MTRRVTFVDNMCRSHLIEDGFWDDRLVGQRVDALVQEHP